MAGDFPRRRVDPGLSTSPAKRSLAKIDDANKALHMKSLGGKSPMQLAMQHLPGSFFKEYGLEPIDSDKVIPKPKLLGIG